MGELFATIVISLFYVITFAAVFVAVEIGYDVLAAIGRKRRKR